MKGAAQAFPETGDVRSAEDTGAAGSGLFDAGPRADAKADAEAGFGADFDAGFDAGDKPDFPGAPRAADRIGTLSRPPGPQPVVRPEPVVPPKPSRTTPPAQPQASGAKPVVRDPWDESGSGAGHTHDPHEVTVQLDAVGGNGDGRSEGGGAGGDSGSEGSDGPVFVDESGRRSRRFRRIGMAVGLACAVYAVVIVVTLLSGNSNAPWLPVTGPKDDAPAGKVDTSPVPAESADPALPVGVLPGTTPTVSGGATPVPGVSGTAPGVVVSPARPGASADPSAPATQPGGNPSVSADPSAQPTPSVTPPASPTVTPPATTSPDPSVAPTQTTGGDSAGPGTVADGPAAPSPIASDPPPSSAPPAGSSPAGPSDAPLSSPSPENIL
ncbi:hypothetical protein ACFUIY_33505 [Streptomyces griseorubiginosus]|uniref:hypothetical protein n=1 Tax=Streptomyces griseorubiginosus TaxID=67304 RepID=UPI00362CB32A